MAIQTTDIDGKKALSLVLKQIESTLAKGQSCVWAMPPDAGRNNSQWCTLDLALGGGLPKGGIEIYGPESSGRQH